MSTRYSPTLILKQLALLLTICLLAPGAALGEAQQTHNSIRKAAEQHVLDELSGTEDEVSVEAGNIDSRLRLAACEQPLETFAPYRRGNSARITVGVRCNDTTRWTLYVPVSVSRMEEIVVASRPLNRGALITTDDVRLELRDVARLHRGYITSLEQAAGKRVKRRIQVDGVVTPDRIMVQHAVKKGNLVTILARIGSLEVRVKGKALDSGAIGERIKVRNSSSERELEATIVARGTVRVAT
ncbi:MAG: flagellar basal body P-ring formation chaperone FlgA [Sedimenticola sp.]|nr:flagellar basal body P-ring formation chaperone FlgA [Sedimenticola sp.]